MRCAICAVSIGNAEQERWGPEFAHTTCVIAFKHGQIDGQETEREACAKIADAKDDMMEYGAGEEIMMRSNVRANLPP